MEKREHHRWILHIRISQESKFWLKLSILIFLIKFTQKGYFWSKTKKVNTTNQFCIFELVSVPNFSLNWQISPTKKVNITIEFCVFSMCRHQISLFTHNLEFLEQICAKRIFPVENEKLNITIEFYKIKLVYLPNFILNWDLNPARNLRKTAIYDRKIKKWTPLFNFKYSS